MLVKLSDLPSRFLGVSDIQQIISFKIALSPFHIVWRSCAAIPLVYFDVVCLNPNIDESTTAVP